MSKHEKPQAQAPKPPAPEPESGIGALLPTDVRLGQRGRYAIIEINCGNEVDAAELCASLRLLRATAQESNATLGLALTIEAP